MPDICIIYSKEDKPRVEKFGKSLKSYGWDVWWFKYTEQGNWESHVRNEIKASKCVIPVWTKTSVDTEKIVMNEAKYAKEINRPLYPVKFDDVELPIQFNLENTTDLIGWDGEKDALKDLISKLRSILSSPSWNGKRPYQFNFDGIKVALPCFVRSVSSYETQLAPDIALKSIDLLGATDPILVSAYDVYLPDNATAEEIKKNNKIVKLLNKLKNKGCLILMDSGKYEASRKGELELNDKEIEYGLTQKVNEDYLWTEERFNTTLDYTFYNYAFCFDDIYPPKSVKETVVDTINRVSNKKSNKIIPIVHAPIIKSKGARSIEILIKVIYELANKLRPPMIATPERELGEGIIERARTVANIRDKFNELDFYQPLHILGTGNPISIAILAAAGADLFDGLEWCRTTVDRETATLHHHQHMDFFAIQTINNSLSTYVKELIRSEGATINFKRAVHNLDFMSEWMTSLQDDMKKGEIVDTLNIYLPQGAIKLLRENIPGIFK